MNTWKKSAAGFAAVLALGTLAACGDDEEPTTGTSDDTTSEAPAPEDEEMSDAAADLVGPGCAGYAEQVPDGDGSVEGMALLPVTEAAAANPLLKTLVAAVSGGVNPDVDLTGALNQGEFTVFAPVDDAFAALPAETLEAIATPEGAETLETVLLYHVLEGKITPDSISGEQATLQGGTVEVTGSGDNLKVNGANVICGGVKTENATVYLIDQVLMPS